MQFPLLASWVPQVAFASHVLGDAPVGTAPLLWPLGDWRIHRRAYHLGEVRLLMVLQWIVV